MSLDSWFEEQLVDFYIAHGISANLAAACARNLTLADVEAAFQKIIREKINPNAAF